MQELLRYVEPPRRCSYLPGEKASLEVLGVGALTGDEYADLLARGYRRFGWQIFRPACRACRKCRSVRLLPQEYELSGSERRVMRKNAHIRADLRPLSMTREHIALYNGYHRFMHQHRGWPLQQTSPAAYAEEFLSGRSDSGKQWLYFDRDRLVGVSLMDEVPGAISLVYFFYDPEWRALSPGIFSILNQLRYAKAAGVRYAYLGYWIEECPSMQYKGRFRPREILVDYPAEGTEPVWVSD